MWDQHTTVTGTWAVNRIIPTYVGSTRFGYDDEEHGSNHSHVCGINSHNRKGSHKCGESFPRMWDQRIITSERRPDRRIIPTYVGSTKVSSIVGLSMSNHSHVCGINVSALKTIRSKNESFPRMWDQPVAIDNTGTTLRIIPTYVGSTQTRRGCSLQSPNHSHVCGINGTAGSLPECCRESFPRMWDQPMTGAS